MKAAFGLRFLPLFLAFFFAIFDSPLNVCRFDSRPVFCRSPASGDEKMHDIADRCQRFSEGKRVSFPLLFESSHASSPCALSSKSSLNASSASPSGAAPSPKRATAEHEVPDAKSQT